MSNNSNTISFKFVLNDGVTDEPEVRRFSVDRQIGTSLVLLQKLLASVYPNLGFKPFRLTWTDNDGDKVSIGSDIELMTALNEMKGPVYKFHVEVKRERKPQEQHLVQRHVHHVGVKCDACERPIVGTRYKCVTCPDYDLCKSCEESGAHLFHNMIRVATPTKAYPKLYLSAQKPAPESHPHNDVIGWMNQHGRRGSNPSCQVHRSRTDPTQHDPVEETPLEKMIRQMIRMNEDKPVRAEAQKPAAKPQPSASKPQELRIQVVHTPFGPMACWLSSEDGQEVQNQDQAKTKQPARPQEVKREAGRCSKQGTPERETCQACPKRSMMSALEKSMRPDNLEVQVVETPFGRMLYLLPTPAEETAQPVQKPKAEDTNAHQPTVPKETKEKSPAPEGRWESSVASQEDAKPTLMSALDQSKRPEGLELQLVDTPFGRMFFWVRSSPEEKAEAKTEAEKAPATKQTDPESGHPTEKPVEPQVKPDSKVHEVPINVLEHPQAEERVERSEEEKSEKVSVEQKFVTDDHPAAASENFTAAASAEVAEQQLADSGVASDQDSRQSDSVEQNCSNANSSVDDALQAMLNMGFSDDGGWLTKLLLAKGGNVGSALDALHGPMSAASA